MKDILTDEIWLLVFDYLTLNELGQVRQVCRQARQLGTDVVHSRKILFRTPGINDLERIDPRLFEEYAIRSLIDSNDAVNAFAFILSKQLFNNYTPNEEKRNIQDYDNAVERIEKVVKTLLQRTKSSQVKSEEIAYWNALKGFLLHNKVVLSYLLKDDYDESQLKIDRNQIFSFLLDNAMGNFNRHHSKSVDEINLNDIQFINAGFALTIALSRLALTKPIQFAYSYPYFKQYIENFVGHEAINESYYFYLGDITTMILKTDKPTDPFEDCRLQHGGVLDQHEPILRALFDLTPLIKLYGLPKLYTASGTVLSFWYPQYTVNPTREDIERADRLKEAGMDVVNCSHIKSKEALVALDESLEEAKNTETESTVNLAL